MKKLGLILAAVLIGSVSLSGVSSAAKKGYVASRNNSQHPLINRKEGATEMDYLLANGN